MTPSYRLLPEATGDDVLSDALDAAKWVMDNITPRVILTGASAGGFLAVATSAQLTSPRPLAVLSIYGMLDLSHPEFVDGSRVGPSPVFPEAVTEPLVKKIRAARGAGVIDAYPFPEDPSKDERMLQIAVMKQLALFPEIVTGVPGLSEQIKASGTDIIEPKHQKFFPLSFGLSENYPPTALVHGEADDIIETSQSTAAADKLREFEVDVVLATVPGGGHGFDLDPTLDIDAVDAETSDTTRALRKMVDFLALAARHDEVA